MDREAGNDADAAKRICAQQELNAPLVETSQYPGGKVVLQRINFFPAPAYYLLVLFSTSEGIQILWVQELIFGAGQENFRLEKFHRVGFSDVYSRTHRH